MIATAAVALSMLLPSAFAADADTPFDPEYYANPWDGVCASGRMQTPIDLPLLPGELPSVPEELITDMQMPVVKKPMAKNVGSAMQVTWDPATAFDMDADTFPMVAAGGSKISDVLLNDAPVDGKLKMIPLQVHWHTVSEHSVGGMMAPMEAHIVTAVAPGEAPAGWGCDAVWEGGDPVLEKCIAVFGIMYNIKEGATTPKAIDMLFDSFPTVAGEDAPYSDPQLDLNALLPADKSYNTYVGSLTTPPCAEGLRWHVFTNYVPISLETVAKFEGIMSNITDKQTGQRQLYRHNNRPVQPLNGRDIWHHSAGGSSVESENGAPATLLGLGSIAVAALTALFM